MRGKKKCKFNINDSHRQILIDINSFVGVRKKVSMIKYLASKHACSERNIRKRLVVLNTHKYIRKAGKYPIIWSLTDKGIKEVQKFLVVSDEVQFQDELKEKPNSVRLHDVEIAFKISLQEKKHIEHVFKTTLINEGNYKKRKMSNWEQSYVSFEELQIRTTTKHMIIKMPECYGEMPGTAKREMIKGLYSRVIPKLENWLKITLDKPDKIRMKVIRQHNALILNPICKILYKSGFRYGEIYNDKGELTWIWDNSKGKFELENIHKDLGEDQVANFKRWMLGDPLEDRKKLNRIEQVVTDQIELTKEQTNVYKETAQMFKRDMDRHMKLLDALKKESDIRSDIIKEQNKIISIMNKRIEKLEKRNI